MGLLIGYVVVVNAIAMFLTAYDKEQAKNKGRRIPERTLFLWAAIGGAPGVMLGMRIWRHKTKHRSFVLGMPIILLVQIVLLFRYWE
ncbi:DUF1294 domain-containing protein [Paenibacillaceae bacterium WGS1546]|uniref:DUF1294 domain-containing protein n=1 Tax=Cohnella sp. WGS1546 TaxID=3366810 RepID=UPI00372D25D5